MASGLLVLIERAILLCVHMFNFIFVTRIASFLYDSFLDHYFDCVMYVPRRVADVPLLFYRTRLFLP